MGDSKKFINKTIGELVDELKPYSIAMPAPGIALLWTVFAFIITTFIASLFASFRTGVLSQLIDYPKFTLEILSGMGVVLSAVYVVFALSVPGLNVKKAISICLSLIVVLSILFFSSFFYPSAPVSMLGKRPLCFYEGLAYGTVLLGSLVFFVNKRAPLNVLKLGMFAGLASCSLTAVIMHFGCMYDPWHILSHHILPVFILAVIGLFSAKFLVKKI